ncbi:MAG: type II secretion system protein GspL [Pseudomonadota bacterium]
MPVLVIQIPPRQRLHARSPGSAPEPDPGQREYTYAVTTDGFALVSQGRCAAALLPKADSVVAVLADTDVGWHRITLPKAPASRLAAALVGVLEELLLEDADNTLLAVEPQATAGQPSWIAAVHLSWLRNELLALERSQVFVDRVVPAIWPDEVPSGHFAEIEDSGGSDVAVSWSHGGGVAVLRLEGTLARTLVPRPGPPGTRWTTTPSAAMEAEKWLGMPINVMSASFRLLQASRTLWNLRQFSLARKSKGLRAAGDFWRLFLAPRWRPVRAGLITLIVLQVLGLNLWAWHQQSEIKARSAAADGVLTATFPQVRAVLDAPVQMQRELQALRAVAGKPGDNDLEPMLQAAASAWPADRPPVDNFEFKGGRLSLAAAGWSDGQLTQFRSRLSPAGWQVESAEGRITLSRTSLSNLRPGVRR